MPFEFPLRGLLRLRKIYEQRERMRLTLLNGSRVRLRQECDDVSRKRALEFEALEHKLQAGMAGVDFRLEEASLQLQATQQRELAALIEAMEIQVRKQVEMFSESQKKRKSLDSLRDRQLKVFQQVEGRREQQRIDDLFARRHAANLDEEKT